MFLALALSLLAWPRAASPGAADNVILCIGDGMGFEQIKAGRFFMGSNLVFEAWTNRGEVATRSADSAVTDSAAAGTAIAAGHKVNNGVISVALPGDGSAYETVLEYFKRTGRRTGLVTTSYMTDATPAVFAAHATSRTQTWAIAYDYLWQTRPNVLLGGGASGMSVTGAVAAGYSVATNGVQLQAFSTASVALVSGQFGSGPLPYEHDGLGSIPHLSQMTQAALELLGPATNGFFLMVEGGLIDHACHDNNITNCVREVAEFDHAVRVAVDWAGSRSNTLVVVTADHETGGLRVLADNGAGNEPAVSWSTTGHTGTNVGLYAWEGGAGSVTGVVDNTDVYRTMMRSQPIDPAARDIGADGNGGVRTLWDAKPGDLCRLEATDGLIETNWAPLVTVTASTHVVALTDTNTPAGGARFYRLICVR